MDSIFEIVIYKARGTEYPTFQVDSYDTCYANSLDKVEEAISNYVKKTSYLDYLLFFSVEEYSCGKFEHFRYSRNIRFYDKTGKLVDGKNYVGNDVKVKDERFEVGEVVEAIEGAQGHVGILVSRKVDNKSHHIVVGVDDIYYVNYTIVASRSEVSMNIYKKLETRVDAYFKAVEDSNHEENFKEKYLSFCHLFRAEDVCPEFEDALSLFIWQAEKALFSCPIEKMAKTTAYSHDRDIVKYFSRYLQFYKRYEIGEKFINEVAKSKKRELYKVLYGHYPIKH